MNIRKVINIDFLIVKYCESNKVNRKFAPKCASLSRYGILRDSNASGDTGDNADRSANIASAIDIRFIVNDINSPDF